LPGACALTAKPNSMNRKSNRTTSQNNPNPKKKEITIMTKLLVILTPLFFGCFAQAIPANTPPTANVNVVNTPNVNVVNAPSVNVSTMPPVQVDTSTNGPLLVRDADNPARNPFTFNTYAAWDGANQVVTVSFTVPAGKRLVIEQASFDASILSPGEGKKVSVGVAAFQTGGTYTSYSVIGTDVGGTSGPGGARDTFVGSSQMRSYADGGTSVLITAFRSSTDLDTDNIYLYVSGYLIVP
jgi:hypothetical protein